MTNRSLLHVKRYRKRQQELIRKLKDVPCTDCGGRFHWVSMQFDHLRDKKAAISNMYTYSEKRILEEIAKCEVVCANCHAVRTYNRRSTVD